MTERTQEWAERVGREAVALGFVEWEIANCYKAGKSILSQSGALPDFRDRLTELACIAWVEDVAREVYGDVCLRFERNEDGKWWARIDSPFGTEGFPYTGDTLAEACIAAVRAMKGETC